MAKKTLKKATKQIGPKAEAKPFGSAYPVEPHELNGQRQRLKKAAKVGAEALKSPAPAATPHLSPAPAAVSRPAVMPMAVLWPTPAASPGASKSLQAPAQKAQKKPARLAAPEAAPATAAQPAKLPVQWEPAKAPRKAAAVAETPSPAAPPTVKAAFVLTNPGAKRVALSGEFNGWSATATPMKRHAEGRWEATVDLAPGRYQYKFIVDGQWIHDPQACENVWNQHGTLNSVMEVRT